MTSFDDPRAVAPVDASLSAPRPSAARRAVAAVFLLQGFVIGSWALHVPFTIERLGITESDMGLMIVMFGLGSVIAMGLLGVVLPRTGSLPVARLSVAASSLFVIGLATTPTYAWTLVAAPVLSGIIGVASVAMNAQGVEVERRAGASLMSSFHGFWSMGILVGSLAGGFAADRFGPVPHALGVLAIGLAASALAWPHLVDDRGAGKGGGGRFALPRAPAVWVLGLVTLFAFSLDGAAIDWSALLMRQDVGAPVWLWGWPLAALQGVMMAMRFAGDGVRDRFGPVPLLRWGGVLAAAGFALAGAAGLEALAHLSVGARAGLAVAGFAIAGAGLANIVPVALSLAGRVRGVDPGTALAVVSAHGHLGILFMPASIGWAGEHVGFGATFAGLAALPLAIALLAPVGRAAHGGVADGGAADGEGGAGAADAAGRR